MNFGDAIKVLEAGGSVARAGWNGKGMSLELQVPDAHSKMSLPYAFMNTACGHRVPWVASQTDLFAKDWRVVAAPPSAVTIGDAPKPLPPEIADLGLPRRIFADRITAAQISATSARLSTDLAIEPVSPAGRIALDVAKVEKERAL